MRAATHRAGFSLLEVAVAAGIVGSVAVAILGMLGSMAARSADASEAMTALSLADAIAVELDLRARRMGFGAFATDVAAGTNGGGPPVRFVAPRSGSMLLEWPGDPGTPEDAFYLIEISRLPIAVPDTVVPLNVRITWPRVPSGTGESGRAGAAASGRTLSYNLAINR